MNKKKLLFLISLVALLFLMSGCTMPMDENGKILTIGLDTTFKSIMDNEGFFSAIFVYPLAQFINKITPMTNVGVAILLVTIVINGIVLLLTFKQNVAMQKLQTLQPEMDRIQRKYEGKTDENSKMRMAQEMQGLYAKNHINPFGSILVMFIQFPILIAMYHAVQRAEAVATGTFLGISLELTPLQGIQNGQFVYILIFGLMVVSQFVTGFVPQYLANYHAKKEAEKHFRSYKPAKNPNQSMMYFMTIFISVIAISWPTAMSLYWMISNVVNLAKAVIVDMTIQKKNAK